ncbi:MAG: RluA family pseudouridine synthase [Deltaproteobacteria bacterium]|nr:RluA family pseudouridine synthase [Deltaproteobacteria bacterium]
MGFERHQKLTVLKEQEGARLDLFLKERLIDSTRSQIHRWVEEGYVAINSKMARKAGKRLRSQDCVEIAVPAIPSALEPEPIPLKILYEDESIVVIDKPAHLVVYPGAGHRTGTLVHALVYRFPSIASVGGKGRPGIVHRLDKGTSGVLVVAKTAAAYHSLVRQFEKRTVDKRYRAVVLGELSRDSGSIELPIGRDPHQRKKMSIRSRRGKEAWTQYCVRERLKGATDVELVLHSGRTHQIRVHMGALSHPVFGDKTYGGMPPKGGRLYLLAEALGRPALHAARMGLDHPASGERMNFEASLPEDMELLLKKLHL